MLRSLIASACLGLTCVAALAQATEEVPFITSPDNVTLEMLRMADVTRADHVIDLGSGDGRIVILAARRFGATGLGVEIVPDLVLQSRRNAQDAGVASLVEFREQDLFQTDLTPATVITMYLLPEVNLQLRPSLLALRPGTRVVSHDWDMGDWLPDRTTVLQVPNKAVGLEKSSKVHLWVVPAKVDGLWCSGSASLQVTQKYQQVDARIADGGSELALTGRVEGKTVRLTAAGSGPTVLELEGDKLRFSGRSVEFARAQGGRC
ncbi:methyltransferase domain-containing protein [Ramlibacter sp. PS3R-8]|uniref:SAM-dependent methyltransferase n=1 Tax=Ramlibacter sp. PS3R-8 TaxID=3133437 RepID=UPI0030B3DCC2